MFSAYMLPVFPRSSAGISVLISYRSWPLNKQIFMLNEQTILHWFDDVLAFMQQGKLAPWAAVLPQQLQQILQEKEHGDQQRWLDAVAALPEINQVQARSAE